MSMHVVAAEPGLEVHTEGSLLEEGLLVIAWAIVEDERTGGLTVTPITPEGLFKPKKGVRWFVARAGEE